MGTSIEGVFTLTPPCYSGRLILGDTEQPKQSIYEQSETQQYHLGTKLVYQDGRVFRYARNGGTALGKALMTTSEALYARAVDELQATSGTSQEIGDQQVLIDVTTGGTWVENEYADGFLLVNKATGIGDIYKILAQKIRSTDTLMDVLLETPLRTAWAADTEVTLVKNPWREVDVMPTAAAEGTPAGIPLIAVTANYFCWLQRGGYAPCYVDTGETLVKGDLAGYPGTMNVAGACGPVVATNAAQLDAIWGVAVYIATAGEVAILDLTLES